MLDLQSPGLRQRPRNPRLKETTKSRKLFSDLYTRDMACMHLPTNMHTCLHSPIIIKISKKKQVFLKFHLKVSFLLFSENLIVLVSSPPACQPFSLSSLWWEQVPEGCWEDGSTFAINRATRKHGRARRFGPWEREALGAALQAHTPWNQRNLHKPPGFKGQGSMAVTEMEYFLGGVRSLSVRARSSPGVTYTVHEKFSLVSFRD